jgi:hypothetical protein
MPAQQFFIFTELTRLPNSPAVMAARQPLCALQHAKLGQRPDAGTIPSGKSR